jgi:hypothetical protein
MLLKVTLWLADASWCSANKNGAQIECEGYKRAFLVRWKKISLTEVMDGVPLPVSSVPAV